MIYILNLIETIELKYNYLIETIELKYNYLIETNLMQSNLKLCTTAFI